MLFTLALAAASPAPAIEPNAAEQCVAAKVTSGVFVPLPDAKWHYVVSDVSEGKAIVEFRNEDEAGRAGTRHADRYEGQGPVTATCTATLKAGKTERKLASFQVSFGGQPVEFSRRVLICTPAGRWEDYPGPC
jgi:hypothetical protein